MIAIGECGTTKVLVSVEDGEGIAFTGRRWEDVVEAGFREAIRTRVNLPAGRLTIDVYGWTPASETSSLVAAVSSALGGAS